MKFENQFSQSYIFIKKWMDETSILEIFSISALEIPIVPIE